MKIGFDISQTGANKAGCGYVADSLVRTLERIDESNEYLLYPAVGDLFWDPDYKSSTFHPASARMTRVLSPHGFGASAEFWANPTPDFEAQLGNPDLVHIHNFFAPRGLDHARLVWTLHDLDFLLHPDWSEDANRMGCFRGAFGAAQRADLIVSVSGFSRCQFLQVFPHYPSDRIATVPLASRFTQAPQARPSGLPALQPGSFFLSVGTLQPRKNLPRLVRAWARLRTANPDTPALVLVGGSGWLMDEIQRELASPAVSSGLIVTGYIDDQSLAWLYANCFAFAFLALAEGFGLPVLEAMSLGAPVICSNTTSLPEVAGAGALLANPWDEQSIENALARMMREPSLRDRLRILGAARAASFSWDRSAKQLLELYENCLARPKLNAPAAAAAQ